MNEILPDGQQTIKMEPYLGLQWVADGDVALHSEGGQEEGGGVHGEKLESRYIVKFNLAIVKVSETVFPSEARIRFRLNVCLIPLWHAFK